MSRGLRRRRGERTFPDPEVDGEFLSGMELRSFVECGVDLVTVDVQVVPKHSASSFRSDVEAEVWEHSRPTVSLRNVVEINEKGQYSVAGRALVQSVFLAEAVVVGAKVLPWFVLDNLEALNALIFHMVWEQCQKATCDLDQRGTRSGDVTVIS